MIDRPPGHGYASPILRRLLASALAIALGSGALVACSADHPAPPPTTFRTSQEPAKDPGGTAPVGGTPAATFLSTFGGCAPLLATLREHAAAHANSWAMNGSGVAYDVPGAVASAPSAKTAAGANESTSSPAHSTTNNQEQGVDEPDRIETDGTRVITVADGILRVVDTGSRRVTGTLDLSMYDGAGDAQLLLHGDRLLVLTGAASYYAYPAGPVALDRTWYPMANGSTTAILVDLAHSPRIISTFHSNGGYVSARMVGGVARLVVRSSPTFAFPRLPWSVKLAQRVAAYRAVLRHAPLSAWLPTFTITAGGVSQRHVVPCTAVRHPDDFSASSLLSVYTLDTASNLDDLHPTALTADGTTAYQSATDLFIASSVGSATQLHRFDVSSIRPNYLGSAKVPGFVADSYSMSAYGDALRVVTTSTLHGVTDVSALYVLDARTLRVLGHVGGLGRGEQLHAVRFLGPLAYVVTFESVDPLYVIDLRAPAHPRTIGALKITGYSDYLHPMTTGRLLGVGQSVRTDENGNAMVDGLQVSLFDISKSHPARIARVVRKHTPSESAIDPHAFLYWAKTGTVIIPIDSWNAAESGAALVLHAGRDTLRVVGTIRNPAGSAPSDTGIERTLVVGGSVWTMSASGLAVSDLTTLHRQAWIAF